MSTTTTLYAQDTVCFNSDGSKDRNSGTFHLNYGASLYAKYGSVDDAYALRKILGGYIYMIGKSEYSYSSMASRPSIRYLFNSFDFDTASYNDVKSISSMHLTTISDGFSGSDFSVQQASLYEASLYNIKRAITNGIRVEAGISTYSCYVYTKYGYTQSPPPWITVEISDTNENVIFDSFGPSSGYVPKQQATAFHWMGTTENITLGTPTFKTMELQYQNVEDGTSGSITVTPGAYGVHGVTVPAGTFTSDTVKVRVVGDETHVGGVIGDWYTLSTKESLSTAEIVSPKSSMLDGSVDNVFSWSHVIDTSTEPTGADLQISSDGSTWSTLATVTGSAQSTTIVANTLAAGSYYWRVRTYNTDSNAGEWSEAAQFVVVAAPQKPSVTTTQTPRPDISWQSSGQQGYEVSVLSGDTEAYNSGTVYGVAKTMKLPVILSDGEYTVRVRVQNIYGQWSDYGTAALSVSNTEQEAITLQASGTDSATLSWTTSGTFERFVVYRDGDPVAITTETRYTDFSSIGDVIYYVVGLVSSSDNYSKSNAVSITIKPKVLTLICEGVVIPLTESDEEIRSITSARSREVSRYYIYGANYPVEETAENDTKEISFSVAYSHTASAQVLENLFGRTVIVKTPGLEMVTGTLTNVSRMESLFYTAYTCTVTQIYTNEAVAL